MGKKSERKERRRRNACATCGHSKTEHVRDVEGGKERCTRERTAGWQPDAGTVTVQQCGCIGFVEQNQG